MQCVNRMWVLASCKLAALIFTCIYPMVSAMTSYSSLTSWRIFVSRQDSTESDFEFPSMTNGIHEELSFHRLQNNVYYRWISSHFSCKQNRKHKNAELSILAGEDLTPKNPLERECRLEIQRRKQQRWMDTAATNSGAERTSLNEFQMLKFFKSKWKRFWIISLINIWANIAVTKHVLLADEFVPYRPRLLGFHSLHVNAMKCIYVGFSLSKLQSFFWKISLNSCLIRLEGFNNKNSIISRVCSTWPSGKAFARCTEGPEFESGQYLFLFASFLFFSSFFLFLFV